MSGSALSAVAPCAVEAVTLVRTASGEYTAASVEAHPTAAAGLVKLKDGNYGEPIVPAASRFGGLSADLSGLKLGGE